MLLIIKLKFNVVLILCEFILWSYAVNDNCVTKSGDLGICKPIKECDLMIEELNSGNLSHLEPCDFDGEIGIFCCPANSSDMVIKFSKSCQIIIQTAERLGINDFEYSENSRLSSAHELPFMVQIIFRKKGYVGAGVLLSENFVLTAAHTVYFRRSMPIVRFAKSTVDEKKIPNGHDVNVKQVIPHELYVPREVYYDVALLLLEEPVKFYNLVFPICLHNSHIELPNDQKLMLAGWKGNNGIEINEFIKGEVRKVPQSMCMKLYNRTDYIIKLPDGILDSLFCGEIDSCNDFRDLDGPIHVHINNTFFIYGFATTSKANCDTELPGLYTRISDVVDWIERIILSVVAP